jgi:hypothetical protein
MRKFVVLVAMEIEAQSFAGAEREAHKVMGSYFTHGGDSPKNFQTLSIIKGQKVSQ